ncbi:MAG TPA: hypothetical protein VKE95_06020 [Burkholderiales bacterium]|nr:hypothetical protein [Burkholderiales bacterium]
MHLYDRFIGRWEGEAQARLPDGSSRRHYWQIRFERALEGRAIQDIWITPPRDGPNLGKSQRWGAFDNQYGMTLRVYDAKLDAWRVTWIDPCADYRAELLGRQRGDEIFQEGKGSDGAALRWIFSDLQPDSFRWRAEVSRDEGAHWHKAIELLAHRVKEP